MSRRFVSRVVAILLFTSSMMFANSVTLHRLSPQDWNNGTNVSIFIQNIYDLQNSGGTLTYDPTTQTLSLTSSISAIFSGSKVVNGSLGTITLTTGPLQSGTLSGYATFGDGSITITTNGSNGLPNGTLISGTLFGTVHWHIMKNGDFYLQSWWSGTLYGGSGTGGSVVEILAPIPGTNQYTVVQGQTVIPEPGTFAMLGTGMIGVLGAFRRRLRL